MLGALEVCSNDGQSVHNLLTVKTRQGFVRNALYYINKYIVLVRSSKIACSESDRPTAK